MANEERVWTLLDIVDWGKEYFEKKNIDSPRLTIELMLCHLLNIERMQIYTEFDRPLLKSELVSLHEMVIRRAKREPLQYILGYTYFYGFKIKVNKTVIIPRPETEFLVETMLKTINQGKELSILDIGTGSGCIAITLAANLPHSNISAIDISDDALILASENATENNFNNINFQKCDILKENPSGELYDIIISNPPYISLTEYQLLEPELKYYEPELSLTDRSDGLTFYKHFAKIFHNLLKPEGKFFLEFGWGQINLIDEIFRNEGWNTLFLNDVAGIPRVVTNRIDNC